MTWQEEITSIVVQAKLLPQTAGEARHLCATIIRGGEKWVSGVTTRTTTTCCGMRTTW